MHISEIHFPLLENDNPFQLVPGYDPGHTLGTGGQEPHNGTKEAQKIFNCFAALAMVRKEEVNLFYNELLNNKYIIENQEAFAPFIQYFKHQVVYSRDIAASASAETQLIRTAISRSKKV
ncbi:hypothetical protein DSO57_1030054 [Entomophthora muscae]|uniref:Uncharacterized protein n=1 Tax=Entomophthora muscae TaxID=34485 RepID=A0ACC2RFT3_9FUNG|nr:hypothetical protein DSO57_1030054 [Entomophthora muscae]